MLKSTFAAFLVLIITLSGTAQKLVSFTANLQPQVGTNNYLSISLQKVFTPAEAKANKGNIDLALVITQNDKRQILEWYNMSGKDDKIPADLRGTTTGISTLSLDKDQFKKCNTTQDLQRMTGYITSSSLVHFASITDDVNAGVKYHCFLIQMGNGKRALIWLEATDKNNYSVTVKL